MPGPAQFVPLLFRQLVSRQRLDRRPEPSQATDAAENVEQYDRVLGTKLAIAYAVGLETIYRARPKKPTETAVDLACGPGHFTLCLARHLGYSQVTGIDLAPPMVETANRNAAAQSLDHTASFRTGDATALDGVETDTVDLACCTDAVHHFPELSTVTAALREMDRITRPEGLIVVMDLARLKTESLTNDYVDLLGHDYVARDLPQFLEDFRNSMFAAWTTDELRKAVPTDTTRSWFQLYPRGLPTLQVLVGAPAGRVKPFVRRGWKADDHPLIREWKPRWKAEISGQWARETTTEWKMTRTTLFGGACHRLHRHS